MHHMQQLEMSYPAGPLNHMTRHYGLPAPLSIKLIIALNQLSILMKREKLG